MTGRNVGSGRQLKLGYHISYPAVVRVSCSEREWSISIDYIYGRHIENLKTPVQAVFIQVTVTCIVFMPK